MFEQKYIIYYTFIHIKQKYKIVNESTSQSQVILVSSNVKQQ